MAASLSTLKSTGLFPLHSGSGTGSALLAPGRGNRLPGLGAPYDGAGLFEGEETAGLFDAAVIG